MDCEDGGNSSNEQYSSSNSERKEKRNFHRHTPQQIQRLEAYFKECPHPDESQRQELCQELKLEPDQIKFWFQNKRTQSKTQDERSSNILLRGENERIQCENEAMLEALKSVICPSCGGPPLGREERDHNLQHLRLENAQLIEKRDKIANFISKNNPNQLSMVDSLASVRRQHMFSTRTLYGTDQTSQTMSLSDEELRQLFETAASAVEELKRLFSAEEAFWIKSSIDGSDMIDQDSYEKFLHAVKHFRSSTARVESSKDVTVVPIEATHLIEMFLDSEKWKDLFPTIVNKAKRFNVIGSELSIKENCNVLQVIREQLHILSPLVPPREFVILRCCQQIDKGLWIIADVTHHIGNFDIVDASCYKRPSGCLIQALPNAHSKVTWIEHVEVDDKSDTHEMYRELLCGKSGYGAKRWILTLERMCERMALTSILSLPATDWSEVIKTGEGRRNVMKLGERMLKNFNEMLTMSGKVEYPQQSKTGIRVSIRINIDHGQPAGLIVSAASSLQIPLTPLHVFNVLRNMDTRQQWDVLSYGNVVSEIAHISTGSNETNYVTILRPTQQENIRMMLMAQDSYNNDMLMLQDCYMDALGGMLVYAPTDTNTMEVAISGEVSPSNVPILPSGFIISSAGKRSPAAAEEEEEDDGDSSGGGHGTILTVAFQILISGRITTSITKELKDKSVETVSSLISATVQRIKAVLNYPRTE